MDKFTITIERSRTASGYEWFLLVDGRRVQTNEHRVGIFTDRTWQPEQMLPRLLAVALGAAGEAKGL